MGSCSFGKEYVLCKEIIISEVFISGRIYFFLCKEMVITIFVLLVATILLWTEVEYNYFPFSWYICSSDYWECIGNL